MDLDFNSKNKILIQGSTTRDEGAIFSGDETIVDLLDNGFVDGCPRRPSSNGCDAETTGAAEFQGRRTENAARAPCPPRVANANCPERQTQNRSGEGSGRHQDFNGRDGVGILA